MTWFDRFIIALSAGTIAGAVLILGDKVQDAQMLAASVASLRADVAEQRATLNTLGTIAQTNLIQAKDMMSEIKKAQIK